MANLYIGDGQWGGPSRCRTCGLTLWRIRWQRAARVTALAVVVGVVLVVVVVVVSMIEA